MSSASPFVLKAPQCVAVSSPCRLPASTYFWWECECENSTGCYGKICCRRYTSVIALTCIVVEVIRSVCWHKRVSRRIEFLNFQLPIPRKLWLNRNLRRQTRICGFKLKDRFSSYMSPAVWWNRREFNAFLNISYAMNSTYVRFRNWLLLVLSNYHLFGISLTWQNQCTFLSDNLLNSINVCLWFN